jgi:hypothetical protein
MMAEAKLVINAGDVLDVQLTSETVVIETPAGRRASPEQGHITTRMRLFVKEADGAEQVYDFEDTELGVRETQRVAVVRAQFKREPQPVNLLLFNLSSGQHYAFTPGLDVYLAHKPLLGPMLKSLGLAALGAGAVWLISRYVLDYTAIAAWLLAAGAAIMLYPVLVWISRFWDSFSEKARYNSARKRFLAEMSARVQAYAPAA